MYYIVTIEKFFAVCYDGDVIAEFKNKIDAVRYIDSVGGIAIN